MTVEDLARSAGVDKEWLSAFESGERTEELTYELLLVLVRATQPPRPPGWDTGHEHDLQLGPEGRVDHGPGAADYWQRIDAVRASNRSRRSG